MDTQESFKRRRMAELEAFTRDVNSNIELMAREMKNLDFGDLSVQVCN